MAEFKLPETLREAHALIIQLVQRLEGLEALVKKQQARIEELERRLAANSQNSSKPPSSDPPHVKRPPKKEPSGRKPGGQPGHRGYKRELLPPEQVTEFFDYFPDQCEECGGDLRKGSVRMEVGEPLRHQVTEVPRVVADVFEHRLHSLYCRDCGHATCAELPADVPRSAFGPRLQAVVALFSGVYRLSKRTVVSALSDLFAVRISLGAVSATEQVMSEALAPAVTEAAEYVRQQPTVHADETGWREGRRRAWLWIAATAAVTVFVIHARRGAVAARRLLDGIKGVLVTDRWSAYSGWELARRQLCWAHLRRDFQFMAERNTTAARIGKELIRTQRLIFRCWHRVRDGTLSRTTFGRKIAPLRLRVEGLLKQGVACHDAKVSGMCREILAVQHAMWTFVRLDGVEPTNNLAERGLRPAVLWRKTSFGTHSEAGSRFVERMMSAVITLKQQGSNILDYLAQASEAALHRRSPPSLLPHATRAT